MLVYKNHFWFVSQNQEGERRTHFFLSLDFSEMEKSLRTSFLALEVISNRIPSNSCFRHRPKAVGWSSSMWISSLFNGWIVSYRARRGEWTWWFIFERIFLWNTKVYLQASWFWRPTIYAEATIITILNAIHVFEINPQCSQFNLYFMT